MGSGYRKERLSFLRKAVIASASITKQKNVIHNVTEIDISIPRELLREYKDSNNESLSFTGYIAKCFASTILRHPNLNSFISGRNVIYINDIVISILVERRIDNEYVPEPLVINNCDKKSLWDIHSEIRETQNDNKNGHLGQLSGNSWFQFIPSFLLKAFVRIADKNVKMGIKYGKLAITSVGMFTKYPIWLIPHGSATVLLSIGSIYNKLVLKDDKVENREYLNLTVSFDHDIVDGAPAARFIDDLIEEIQSGSIIIEFLNSKK